MTEILERTKIDDLAEDPAQVMTEGVAIVPTPKNPFDGKMFPNEGGLHVPNVARYDSGFRMYHEVEPK